ncbi:MAG: Na+/H+ antiporter NhaA [Chloroflexota bacterium]|nr:Na+/H+ antiporter NhaA [Chloroflexota bacterium]
MPQPLDDSVLLQTTNRGLPLYRALSPFRSFVADQVSGGILLLLATVVALVWANSPWADGYTRLWNLDASITIGTVELVHSLRDWINDGLMALFFFVVGLEIKREILVGELSTRRGATLPIAAALGGMVVPALIYVFFNAGAAGSNGWAIPMATDIAFALGVLAVIGDRIPIGARIFLTALAIIDDIGAVLVIALVYTGGMEVTPLLAAAALLVALFVANRAGVRQPAVYAVLGVGVWLAVFASGVHATVAGVLVAFMIPVRTWIHPLELVSEGRRLLDDLAEASSPAASVLSNHAQQTIIHRLNDSASRAETPLQQLEHGLNPWVAYGIVPLFALANAGVTLPADLSAAVTDPILLGIVGGLVLGKPVGIIAATWLVVRLRLSSLPAEVTWRQIGGLGLLAGIGFTMSIFITGLAFTSIELTNAAKLGILAGSLIAGIAGWLVLRTVPDRSARANAASEPAG